jgi:hypothetical protein
MSGPGYGSDAYDDLVAEGDPEAVDDAINAEEAANTSDDKDDD